MALVQRAHPDGKYIVKRIQLLVVVGRILDFSGLAAIFPGLEPAGLLYLKCSAGESPGDASPQSGHPVSVHRCRMGPASRPAAHSAEAITKKKLGYIK